MAHRTQLHLDEMQYQYLKHVAFIEKKSIAQVIRDWIEEKRAAMIMEERKRDSLFKLRGLFESGDAGLANHFDQALYGEDEK